MSECLYWFVRRSELAVVLLKLTVENGREANDCNKPQRLVSVAKALTINTKYSVSKYPKNGVKSMPRLLIAWKSVNARVPENPEGRLKQFTLLMQMVQEDLKSGKLKDWGIFAEGGGGYAIVEGSEVDLAMAAAKYVPHVEMEARIVLSANQQMELLKKLAQSAPK